LENCSFLEEIRIGMNKMPKGELPSLVGLKNTKPHLRILTVGGVPTLVCSTSFLILFVRVEIKEKKSTVFEKKKIYIYIVSLFKIMSILIVNEFSFQRV
jgi:hypothetical protein